MQKWEYKVFNGRLGQLNDIVLNELGNEGWELVVASELGTPVIIFKRPKL